MIREAHEGGSADARKKRHRSIVVLVATFVALLLLPTTGVGARDEGPTPTIVLVHGAFADPSSWSGVTPILEKDGYETVTPRLALVPVAGDVAYVPAPGESIFSVSEGWAPPAFLAPGHLLFVSATSAIIDPAFFRDDFARDLSPKKAARLAAAQQAVSLDILFTLPEQSPGEICRPGTRCRQRTG